MTTLARCLNTEPLISDLLITKKDQRDITQQDFHMKTQNKRKN